ncbi:MAG TPA: L-lactate dehydrogenase [Aggregatilinea sp.]|uniref:L-lactate dehydrogenase n=1 Tax=Aggregatilinea sp. TaxID=2806333 RepID=UPI002C0A89AB|nr:L-lactate dehydrogenase [Aggregatilinea sp.]HML22226.1 L-lactate dehydrogenase [Aggregatilinea sp.]
MKIGIVGSGMVGATAAYALVMRGVGREIVLTDKNPARARAEADDILHAVPFAQPMVVRSGEYQDLANCSVVIISAGVGQRPGETRLQLLGRNAAVFREVIPSVLKYAPDAVLVVATNPVDIMTHLAARFAVEVGVPASRVLGSGTMLDTARFRALLSRQLGIEAYNVHAYVLGEHGDSEVLAWSGVSIGGIPLDEFCAGENEITAGVRQTIDDQVRRAAYHIIEGKGATYYGVGSALARVTGVILGDQRSLLTVCSPVDEVAGVPDVTVSLPNLVGAKGVLNNCLFSLTDDEYDALRRSALVVKNAIDQLDDGLPS